MHEAGLMMHILELCEAEAAREGAARIKTIALRIGPLSGVEPAALEFAFAALKQGSMAAGARLEIEHVPLVAHCALCKLDFETDDRYGIAVCPVCNEPTAEFLSGNEFEISHLEVEQ